MQSVVSLELIRERGPVLLPLLLLLQDKECAECELGNIPPKVSLLGAVRLGSPHGTTEELPLGCLPWGKAVRFYRLMLSG